MLKLTLLHILLCVSARGWREGARLVPLYSRRSLSQYPLYTFQQYAIMMTTFKPSQISFNYYISLFSYRKMLI